MKINRRIFYQATGKFPELDDLERCNCKKVGEPGHHQCGWCEICKGPRFLCNHLLFNKVNHET